MEKQEEATGGMGRTNADYAQQARQGGERDGERGGKGGGGGREAATSLLPTTTVPPLETPILLDLHAPLSAVYVKVEGLKKVKLQRISREIEPLKDCRTVGELLSCLEATHRRLEELRLFSRAVSEVHCSRIQPHARETLTGAGGGGDVEEEGQKEGQWHLEEKTRRSRSRRKRLLANSEDQQQRWEETATTSTSSSSGLSSLNNSSNHNNSSREYASAGGIGGGGGDRAISLLQRERGGTAIDVILRLQEKRASYVVGSYVDGRGDVEIEANAHIPAFFGGTETFSLSAAATPISTNTRLRLNADILFPRLPLFLCRTATALQHQWRSFKNDLSLKYTRLSTNTYPTTSSASSSNSNSSSSNDTGPSSTSSKSSSSSDTSSSSSPSSSSSSFSSFSPFSSTSSVSPDFVTPSYRSVGSKPPPPIPPAPPPSSSSSPSPPPTAVTTTISGGGRGGGGLTTRGGGVGVGGRGGGAKKSTVTLIESDGENSFFGLRRGLLRAFSSQTSWASCSSYMLQQTGLAAQLLSNTPVNSGLQQHAVEWSLTLRDILPCYDNTRMASAAVLNSPLRSLKHSLRYDFTLNRLDLPPPTTTTATTGSSSSNTRNNVTATRTVPTTTTTTNTCNRPPASPLSFDEKQKQASQSQYTSDPSPATAAGNATNAASSNDTVMMVGKEGATSVMNPPPPPPSSLVPTLLPRSGYILNASIEAAGPGGDTRFVKAEAHGFAATPVSFSHGARRLFRLLKRSNNTSNNHRHSNNTSSNSSSGNTNSRSSLITDSIENNIDVCRPIVAGPDEGPSCSSSISNSSSNSNSSNGSSTSGSSSSISSSRFIPKKTATLLHHQNNDTRSNSHKRDDQSDNDYQAPVTSEIPSPWVLSARIGGGLLLPGRAGDRGGRKDPHPFFSSPSGSSSSSSRASAYTTTTTTTITSRSTGSRSSRSSSYLPYPVIPTEATTDEHSNTLSVCDRFRLTGPYGAAAALRGFKSYAVGPADTSHVLDQATQRWRPSFDFLGGDTYFSSEVCLSYDLQLPSFLGGSSYSVGSSSSSSASSSINGERSRSGFSGASPPDIYDSSMEAGRGRSHYSPFHPRIFLFGSVGAIGDVFSVRHVHMQRPPTHTGMYGYYAGGVRGGRPGGVGEGGTYFFPSAAVAGDRQYGGGGATATTAQAQAQAAAAAEAMRVHLLQQQQQQQQQPQQAQRFYNTDRMISSNSSYMGRTLPYHSEDVVTTAMRRRDERGGGGGVVRSGGLPIHAATTTTSTTGSTSTSSSASNTRTGRLDVCRDVRREIQRLGNSLWYNMLLNCCCSVGVGISLPVSKNVWLEGLFALPLRAAAHDETQRFQIGLRLASATMTGD